jgi:hypothetical protein
MAARTCCGGPHFARHLPWCPVERRHREGLPPVSSVPAELPPDGDVPTPYTDALIAAARATAEDLRRLTNWNYDRTECAALEATANGFEIFADRLEGKA